MKHVGQGFGAARMPLVHCSSDASRNNDGVAVETDGCNIDNRDIAY